MRSSTIWRIDLLSVLFVFVAVFSISFGVGIPDRISSILFLFTIYLFLLPVFYMLSRKLRVMLSRGEGNYKRLLFISIFTSILLFAGYYLLYWNQVKCLGADCVYFPFILDEGTAESIRLAGGKTAVLNDGPVVKEALKETTGVFSWAITDLTFWMTLFLGGTSSFITFYFSWYGFFMPGFSGPSGKIRAVRADLQNLISQNKLPEALDLLLDCADGTEFKEEVILMKAACLNNETMFSTGEIGSEAYNEFMARMRRVLLGFVNQSMNHE